MKATLEEITKVQKRLRIKVPQDKVNSKFSDLLKKYQQKSRVQGFRPGKAPLTLVKRLYGSELSYEVSRELINDNLFKAIEDVKLNPIGKPFVETEALPVQDTEYEFSAVVDVMSPIEIPDNYAALNIECKRYTFRDDMVDDRLKAIARSQAKMQAAAENSTAQANNQVATISHKAWLDGVELPQFNVSHFTVDLGSGQLFTELEQQVIGMGIGENKEFDLKLPADYGAEELRDKTLKFSLTLENLQDLVISTIDDEFAKDLQFESLAVLKTRIAEDISNHIQNMNEEEVEQNILKALSEKINLEVPPTIIDQVIDEMITNSSLEEDHRKKAFKDSKLRESLIPTARTRAKNTLMLWEIIKKENLTASEEEVRDFYKTNSAGQTDTADFDQLNNRVKAELKESLTLKKTIDFIKAQSQINFIDA